MTKNKSHSSHAHANTITLEEVELVEKAYQQLVVNRVVTKILSIFMILMANPRATLSMILEGQKERLSKYEKKFTKEHHDMQKQIYDALPNTIDVIISMAKSCAKVELPAERLAAVKKQLQEHKEQLFTMQIKEELLDLLK